MDYKQSTISGTSWVRCRAVTIVNPLEPVPSGIDGTLVGPVAYFQEEKVMLVDGANMRIDIGSCAKVFDPAASIPMCDPTTGDLTGSTITQGELYVVLYSLYMQTALERDSQNP